MGARGAFAFDDQMGAGAGAGAGAGTGGHGHGFGRGRRAARRRWVVVGVVGVRGRQRLEVLYGPLLADRGCGRGRGRGLELLGRRLVHRRRPPRLVLLVLVALRLQQDRIVLLTIVDVQKRVHKSGVKTEGAPCEVAPFGDPRHVAMPPRARARALDEERKQVLEQLANSVLLTTTRRRVPTAVDAEQHPPRRRACVLVPLLALHVPQRQAAQLGVFLVVLKMKRVRRAGGRVPNRTSAALVERRGPKAATRRLQPEHLRRSLTSTPAPC